MRQRKQPAKRLRGKTTKIARRNAQTAVRGPSMVELQEQLDIRTQERDEALEQQAATAEVLKVISSSTGKLEPVFQTILENSITICEAKFGMFWLTEGHSFRCVALHGTSPAFTELRRREPIFHPNPTLLTPLGRIARSKQLVHVADCRAEQAYIEGDPGFVALVDLAGARTILVVPILRDNELVGALNIFRQEILPFTDKQIELVKNFAAQAVIAIENTRLLNELRESLEQQTATSEVLKVVSSSPADLEPVFDALLTNAIQVCEAKFGFMYRANDTEFKIMAHKCDVPAYLKFAQNTRFTKQTIVGRVAETKQVIQVVDIAATQRYADREPLAVAAVEIGHVRTILGVPLLNENEVKGAILLYRQEVRPFTDKQIDLVKNFAAQAVIAIENARLLNELRQRTDDLSESLEQQTATSEILEVISNSPTDTQPAFDAIVRSGLNLFPDSVVAISLPDRDLVKLAAIAGADKAGLEALRGRYPMPLSHEFITGTTILDRREIDLADAQDPPKELTMGARNLLAGGYRAMTVMPMMRGDETIGTLNVVRRQPGPLSDKQRELLRTFAKQAVIAIENTRLFNELRESLEQQTATSEVLRVISSSPGELEPVFKAMLENATLLCEASHGAMWMREGGGLRNVARHCELP